MALKFFTIPVRDPAPWEAEVNGFLGSHRILAVERQFVDVGENSFWSIAIDYLPLTPTGGRNLPAGTGRKERVDYREVLSPEDFALFVRLRDLRKQMALAEAVPVYTLFTNDQLAEMVRRRVRTRADFEGITGVGDARVGKYADPFLALLATPGGDHEAVRPPV